MSINVCSELHLLCAFVLWRIISIDFSPSIRIDSMARLNVKNSFSSDERTKKRFGLDQVRPSMRIRAEETRGDLNIFVNHLIEVETFKSTDPFDPSSTNSNAPHTSSALDTLSPLTRRSDRIGLSIQSVYSTLHSRHTRTTKIKLHHISYSLCHRSILIFRNPIWL